MRGHTLLTNQKIALDNTLIEEGGYADNPKDPGGATNCGVTQATYNSYRISNKLALQDVRKISDAELQNLYADSYWGPAKCDSLPNGLDAEHFDMAVNAGVREAAKVLQRACNRVRDQPVLEVDGMIGPATLAVIDGISTLALINEYANERIRTYQTFKDWPTFGTEWTGRVKRIASKSVKLYINAVAGAVPSGPVVPQQPVQSVPSPTSPGAKQGGFIAFLQSVWQRWFG